MEVFSVRKGVVRNFAEFTGTHLCFPVKFAKFLRTPFLQNTPTRLLLSISKIDVPAKKGINKYL